MNRDLKRCLEFLVLGFIGLLLAGAASLSPMPVAEHATFSVQASSPAPAKAAKETSEGPVLSAYPVNNGHSRIDQSSPHGITSQLAIPEVLESQGLDAADFFAGSAHEPGFDQFLRAPPLNS